MTHRAFLLCTAITLLSAWTGCDASDAMGHDAASGAGSFEEDDETGAGAGHTDSQTGSVNGATNANDSAPGGNSAGDPRAESDAGVDDMPGGDSRALPESGCGIGFSALGNSVSNSMCVRIQGGGAACSDAGNEKVVLITDSASAPLTNVRYATGGTNWQGALVVLDSGALYETQGTKLKAEPLIAEGVISASAGYQHACALIEAPNGLDVRCWRAGANLVARPPLAPDMSIRQLSVTYDYACVLNDLGEVWCWANGAQSGNYSEIRETPQKVAFSAAGPVVFVAAGQREVCGILTGGALSCVGNFAGGQFYSVPLKADASFDDSIYPALRAVHLGQAQGCFVHANGTAECRGQEIGQKGREAAPILFAGANDVIAAAGNKGQACVLSRDGSLHCIRKETGSAKRALLPDGTPVVAQIGSCPR